MQALLSYYSVHIVSKLVHHAFPLWSLFTFWKWPKCSTVTGKEGYSVRKKYRQEIQTRQWESITKSCKTFFFKYLFVREGRADMEWLSYCCQHNMYKHKTLGHLWPQIHVFHLNGCFIFSTDSPPRQMNFTLQHIHRDIFKWVTKGTKETYLWRTIWYWTWISN